MAKLIRVTLTRGLSKLTDRQVATLQGLGLRKRHQMRVVEDTKSNRGMILKMQHMLEVEAFEGDDSLRMSTRRTRKAQAGSPS